MNGYRQAAVALHGIAEEDRAWVLNALPATDKATLQQLLAELKELGFAEDPSISADIAADSLSPARVIPPSQLERVRYASAEQMYAILKNEPSSLIAQVLSVERWSWTTDFLGLFLPIRKEKILAAVIHTTAGHTMTAAPARTRFLVETIATRLAELSQSELSTGKAHSQGASDKGTTIFSPLRRWMASWIQ